MKKIGTLGLCTFITFGLLFADVSAIKVEVKSGNTTINVTQKYDELEMQEVFKFYAELLAKDVPESYKYIDLKYKNITKGTILEDSLKKLIYLDVIKNIPVSISYTQKISDKQFYTLSESVLGMEIFPLLKNDFREIKNATTQDIHVVEYLYKYKLQTTNAEEVLSGSQKAILEDVYKTIKTDFYGKDSVNDKELLYGAISGLAASAGDKHTVYFPPTESRDFQEGLDGDFEGIGAYVELRSPGKFYIVSALPDSPAQKAGLQGGDRVLQVDDNKVTEKNSQKEIISWVKGKQGTVVRLLIERNSKTFEVEVIRGKIHIAAVNIEKKGTSTYYLQITRFGENVSEEFTQALNTIKNDSTVKKIIIDVRNNGGGYLEEVTKMLSHLVPKGETTTIVEYLEGEQKTYSLGYETINLSDYKVVVLINAGTASASEILIGTLKDYFPNIVVVGEKSYGKGSVQSIKQYFDGSSLKYTIARWFTGKTKTGIDGVGITPDIQLDFDAEKYSDKEIDNQLEKALEL